MKMLRFRSPYEEAWTFCSFAGEREEDAAAILASVVTKQDFEVHFSDGEDEEWTVLGEDEA